MSNNENVICREIMFREYFDGTQEIMIRGDVEFVNRKVFMPKYGESFWFDIELYFLNNVLLAIKRNGRIQVFENGIVAEVSYLDPRFLEIDKILPLQSSVKRLGIMHQTSPLAAKVVASKSSDKTVQNERSDKTVQNERSDKTIQNKRDTNRTLDEPEDRSMLSVESIAWISQASRCSSKDD